MKNHLQTALMILALIALLTAIGAFVAPSFAGGAAIVQTAY